VLAELEAGDVVLELELEGVLVGADSEVREETP